VIYYCRRERVLKKTAIRYFGAILIAMCMFMVVLALYFGAMFNPSSNNLRVLIVNKDQGVKISANTSWNFF
jgi:hypothetical protein